MVLSPGNESRDVIILDFNVNESTNSVRVSDSNWTNVYPQFQFACALAPEVRKLHLETACVSFMLDEGFVLGLQVREELFRVYFD